MANRQVTIWRYAKTDGAWKYHKPTYGRNNKIKPEGGAYYIRWRNGSKMEWQRCHSAANAEQVCRRCQSMLTAQAYGIVRQRTRYTRRYNTRIAGGGYAVGVAR